MRFPVFVLFCCAQTAWAAGPVAAFKVSVQTLQIANTGARNVELVCPRKGPAPLKPPAAPTEPTELPDDDDVSEALQSAATHLPPAPQTRQTLQARANGWRIAIWGDSHTAAAFFSDQLVRKMLPADATVTKVKP